MPVLPTQPSYNHLSVHNLRFLDFHGMEEVIDSKRKLRWKELNRCKSANYHRQEIEMIMCAANEYPLRGSSSIAVVKRAIKEKLLKIRDVPLRAVPR